MKAVETVQVSRELEAVSLSYCEIARRAFPDLRGVVLAVEGLGLHRTTKRQARRRLLEDGHAAQAKLVAQHDQRTGLLVVLFLLEGDILVMLVQHGKAAAA